MLFNKLKDVYFAEKDLTPSTKNHFNFVIGKLIRDTRVDTVENLTREHMLSWRSAMMAKNVQPATWNNYLRHVSVLIKFADERGLVNTVPCLKGLALRGGKELPKVVKYRDLQKVLAFLKSGDSRCEPGWFWSAVIKTLYYTGMRRRQLCGLAWRDINFGKLKIYLDKNASKNRTSWTVPMTIHVSEALWQLRERTLEIVPDDKAFRNRPVFDISLFNERYKGREGGMEPTTVSDFFKRLSVWTDVRISAHRLRHTVATQLAKQGNYKELQMLLGHAKVQTTMKYIHPDIDELRVLVNTLGSIDADDQTD